MGRREEASRARLTPTPPSPRAALLAFARSYGRSPGRCRVLSMRRARAPLPPSASWYPFPRYAQCATLASIGPHRSIGLLVRSTASDRANFGGNVHRRFSLKVLQIKTVAFTFVPISGPDTSCSSIDTA